MRVREKAFIHIDPLLALIRGTLTMAAERVEIIRPWLAHRCCLAQGTGTVLRSSPTDSHASHMALDGPCMDIESPGLFEERRHMLGLTDRALPMFVKHQLTSLAFCH